MLKVNDLSVSYQGSIRGLDGVSLELGDGEIVAVLGNNGAGKTTLLRALSGVLPRHRGEVVAGTLTVAGQDATAQKPLRRVRQGVIQVPEGRRVFSRLDVEENLRAGATTTARGARAAALERVFDLFPVLAERRTQRAGLLSGGEQQMLAMGRALMSEPKILLLDEPSLGLAPRIVEQIGDIIREVNEQGTSVLLVEQNAGMALDLATTAYVLDLGRVTLHGPAHELAASSAIRDLYLGHTQTETITTFSPSASALKLRRWSA